MKKITTLMMMALLFTLKTIASVDIPTEYYSPVGEGKFAFYDVDAHSFWIPGLYSGKNDAPQFVFTLEKIAGEDKYYIKASDNENPYMKLGWFSGSGNIIFYDGVIGSTAAKWSFTKSDEGTFYTVCTKQGDHVVNEAEGVPEDADYYIAEKDYWQFYALTDPAAVRRIALITEADYEAFLASNVVTATSISNNARTTLNWKDATVANCQSENDGNNIGYTGGSSVATLSIANDVAGQGYLLEFNTGADGCSAVITVTLKNDAGVVAEQDFTIENIGTWSLDTYHSLFIPSLAKGEYELEFKVKSNEGSFAGNWGKPTFTKVSAIPGTLDLYAGVYAPQESWAGIQVEHEGANVGYIKDGRSATYLIYNAVAQPLDLTIGIIPLGGGGAMNVKMEDVESGATDYTKDLTIVANSEETTETFAVGNLSKGLKRLTLTFSSEVDDWICNYKDVTFAAPTIDVVVTDAGYATLYYADAALEIPEGVKAYTVHEKSATKVELVAVDGTIPAGEPVLLEVAEGTYQFTVATAATVAKDADNRLRGADADGNMTAESGVNFYKFAKDTQTGVGFYLGVADGSAFNVGSTGKKYNKAYLTLPKSAGASIRLFGDDDDMATGIKAVEGKAQQAVRHNLAGRRVDADYKGIVIVNGKRILAK